MPSPSQGERVRQLELVAQDLTNTVKVLQSQASEFARIQEELRGSLATLDKNHALLQQRHDDHVRRAEVWGQRWWALVPLLVGAVLSLCSALIVSLARK